MKTPATKSASKPANPGSDDAINEGCLCPVLDNEHGEGCGCLNGNPLFWIEDACPLHGKKDTEMGVQR